MLGGQYCIIIFDLDFTINHRIQKIILIKTYILIFDIFDIYLENKSIQILLNFDFGRFF